MAANRELVNRTGRINDTDRSSNSQEQAGSGVDLVVDLKSGYESQALTPARILALQRSMGNQAVLRMLAKSGHKPVAQHSQRSPVDTGSLISTPTTPTIPSIQRDPTMNAQVKAGIKSFGDSSKLPDELRGPVQYGFQQPSTARAGEMMAAGTKSAGKSSTLPEGMRGKVVYDAPVRNQASCKALLDDITALRVKTGEHLRKTTKYRHQIEQMSQWMAADFGYLKEKAGSYSQKTAASRQEIKGFDTELAKLNASEKGAAKQIKKLNASREKSSLQLSQNEQKKNVSQNASPAAGEWLQKGQEYKSYIDPKQEIVEQDYDAVSLEYKVADFEYGALDNKKTKKEFSNNEWTAFYGILAGRAARAEVKNEEAAAIALKSRGYRNELSARQKHVTEKENRGESLTKYIAKKIGMGIASAATLGLLSFTTSQVAGTGGYASETKLEFGPWAVIKDTKTRLMMDWAGLKSIWRNKLMGGSVLSGIFVFLKFIGEMVIKPVRDLMGIIATISGLLALPLSIFFPPLGAVLTTIASVAVGLALKLSIIKGMINAVLAAWSFIATLASDDARKRSQRKSEATGQGMQMLGEGVRVAVPVGVMAGHPVNPGFGKLSASDAFSPAQEGRQLGNLGGVYNSHTAGLGSSMGNKWVEGSNFGLGADKSTGVNFGALGKNGETPALPAAIGGGEAALTGQGTSDTQRNAKLEAALNEKRDAALKKAIAEAKANLAKLSGSSKENVTESTGLTAKAEAAAQKTDDKNNKAKGEERQETTDTVAKVKTNAAENLDLSSTMAEVTTQAESELTLEGVKTAGDSLAVGGAVEEQLAPV